MAHFRIIYRHNCDLLFEALDSGALKQCSQTSKNYHVLATSIIRGVNENNNKEMGENIYSFSV